MEKTLPEGWKYLTLGELTEKTRPICYGVLKPGPFIENGVPLIRITDISTNNFDSRNIYKISPELDNEFKRSRLDGGEILLSIQGTIGKVAICPHEFGGANISRTIAVIKPDERADPQYVRSYLVYLAERGKFSTVGTTRASFNIGTLRKLKIPLPRLETQRKIMSILEKAEAIKKIGHRRMN